MSNISKYLESQLALAQKKSSSKKNIVSEKSKKSADLVSKQQNQNLKNTPDSARKCRTSDNTEYKSNVNYSNPYPEVPRGSEYEPSSEDDEELVSMVASSASSISRSRHKTDLNKILDDGDKKLYDQRLEKWKNTLKLVIAGGTAIEKCDVHTADITYLMEGNKDGEDNHEVSGGLLVPKYIWKQLYKYQRTGVKWLWELHQIKSGGLLGDEMGLGKTVQLIAFLAGLSRINFGSWGGLGPTIIVTPATVIYQWVSHFHYWYPTLRVAVLHNSGSHSGSGIGKGHHSLIREIHGAHGVLLITYAGIVRYNADLLSRNWHYIILDEGHKIRNPDTQVSKMVKKFKTPHKILITGSPMQNSLQELWSLFDFMCPGLLGTQMAFMEYFALPITQGGYSNATQLQEVTAFEIAKSLKNIITPYMIRRSKAEVQEHINLPEKNEQVLFCSLSQEQRDLYLGYLLSGTVRSILDKDSRYGDPIRARILVAISTLRKICNHPDLYLYEPYDEDDPVVEDNFGHWRRSGKMIVVQSLLKIWQKQGHRALIFSQSRGMLCILEQFLTQNNYNYLKMDGTVSVGLRQNLIKTFNENTEYLVFLATTRVGGLGVNLTGADRVIIYDPDWNPATDSQAKERAWRIGQRRNVTIYRLLSAGTIEEKIYQRQVFKHLLSNKVLIDPNQKNLLKTSNLQGLFTLEEPNREGDTETASIFSHTKVGMRKDKKEKSNSLYGSVSFSQKKMAAMRKKAQEISRKIAKSSSTVITTSNIDGRERYKIQRELSLRPQKTEEPEINVIDDNVTDFSFDAVLSELDIVNLHTKKDYLEKLISLTAVREKEERPHESDHVAESSKSQSLIQNEKEDEDMKLKNEELPFELDILDHSSKSFCNETKVVFPQVDEQAVVINSKSQAELRACVDNRIEKTQDKKYRKRIKPEIDTDIEGLVSIKKVKKKHKDKNETDDDYVLTKLFAKSGVQSALEHDKIVGLAEKEEHYRLKEEATKKAKEALRALKKSMKRNLM